MHLDLDRGVVVPRLERSRGGEARRGPGGWGAATNGEGCSGGRGFGGAESAHGGGRAGLLEWGVLVDGRTGRHEGGGPSREGWGGLREEGEVSACSTLTSAFFLTASAGLPRALFPAGRPLDSGSPWVARYHLHRNQLPRVLPYDVHLPAVLVTEPSSHPHARSLARETDSPLVVRGKVGRWTNCPLECLGSPRATCRVSVAEEAQKDARRFVRVVLEAEEEETKS